MADRVRKQFTGSTGYIYGNTATQQYLYAPPKKRKQKKQLENPPGKKKQKNTEEDVEEWLVQPKTGHEKVQIRMERRNARVTVFFMIFSALFLTAIGFQYLSLKGQITKHEMKISSLEMELAEVRMENKATKSRISAAEDIEHIKSVAMEKFGMVYPSQEQIVAYKVESPDYMVQYERILEEESAEELLKQKEKQDKQGNKTTG